MTEQEKKLNATLDKFFQGLLAELNCLREVRQIYDEQVAFEFNSVNLFGPNENKISKILAFFLDPSKPHGQKDKFLKIFLEKFNLEKAFKLINDRKVVQVLLESPTNESRRVDIVINIGNDEFMIGIENKIWNAVDQDRQIEHYSRFLKKCSTGNYVLFYLKDGSDPSESSISKDQLAELKENKKLQSISFKEDIIELFEQFELVCQADNVRVFIKDFRKYLKQHFLGEKTMGESKFIVEKITDKVENIKLAFDIISNKRAIQQKLWDSFRRELQSFAKENEFELDCCENVNSLFSTYSTLFRIYPNSWKETKICFQFQDDKRFIYGIEMDEGKQKDFSDFDKLERGHSSAWLVCTYSKYTHWDVYSTTWEMMIKQNNEPSLLMTEFSKIIKSLVDEANKFAETNNLSL